MDRKDDIRFDDVRRLCRWRTQDGDCAHIENDLSQEPEPPCACDFCPIVETDIAEDDDVSYSEGEQPVILIDKTQPPKNEP